MDKAQLSGLVTLWHCGTPEYRLALLLAWPPKDIADLLKNGLKVNTAWELAESLREGVSG